MINFKNWRQYTQVIDSVRFSLNMQEPYVLIYFPENTSFLEDYNKLNIRKLDFKIVVAPMTTVPRTRLTPDLIKSYKSNGLYPYSSQQKIPQGKNIIVDTSQFINAIDTRYNPTSYRQRAGNLVKSILVSAASYFPANYKKILMYSVDLNKDTNEFINRKIFPILKDMKEDVFPFDYFVLNTIKDGNPSYRLLVKEGEYKFQRVLTYLKTFKGISTDEEIEDETFKASTIVIKALNKQIDSNVDKVRFAIKSFLKSSPEDVEKIMSGDITADEVKSLATASILYNTSGDIYRAKLIAKKIPTDRKSSALKAISKTLAADIIPRENAETMSTNMIIRSYNPAKMVDNKSPKHIYKKRQEEFKKNLQTDLTNSFKVLESKEIPLIFESLSINEKNESNAELLKSDINVASITLKDKFGNSHVVKMELPKIDPNTGIFRLNGRQKCLINQIVQNPITFPAPGESRFESSYSVFRIYLKKLRNVQFLEAFMSYKMPLFYLLAFSFGFEETCKQFKIKYEIVNTKPAKGKLFSKIKDKYILFTDVESELQKALCNGFIYGNPDQYDIPYEFPTKQYFEHLIIKITGRINSTFLISSNLQNIIDPVVKQVLLNKQLPIELNYIMQYMSEKVMEGFHIERNDLSNQRIRNSEVLVHLAQKQILAAYTVYKEQVLAGNENAKFEINPTKVSSDFLLTELVTDMEYANPVEEMSTMTRVSPSGRKVGGIPDKRAIQTSARNIHGSYFGNIDPLDTSESGNIGISQQLTIDALITSSRGIFSTKNIDDKEKSGMLSTTTCMVPFLENVDGARVIMLSNQAKQMVPLKNPQPPIVQSGYESILTDVLSNNFIKRAPCTGKILNITHDKIEVMCNGGKKNVVDISPVHLRSGSGKNTLSVFKPLVRSSQIVREGDIIAEGACMSQGVISLGRPLLTALMPYKGFNFEDGVVISESVAANDKLTSLHGIEEEVMVSENDRVLFIAKINETLEKGKPLFKKTFGDIEDIIGFEDDESEDLIAGQYIKKSPGGKIVDIEVYSNVDENKFPILKELIQRTRSKQKMASNEKFKINGESIKGIYIKFKIEQELKSTLGDKLCNRYGNKGIISLVEKDELMPRLPNGERVEIVFNPLGLINRMNIGQLYEMYCGLMAREIASRISHMRNRADVINLVRSVYSLLDTSKNNKFTEGIVANLSRLSDTNFKVLVDQAKLSGFYPIIVPPFKAPKHDQIGKALKLLGLEPSYNLYLPEFNVKTANKVPVGYMAISKLEHMADAKIHARSTGPMTGKTSQPTGGKSREGGQRLGELDSYSYLSYNAEYVLAEMLGPLSDDFVTKEEIISEIVQTGQANYREPKISPAKDLLNSYFVSLMLSKD